MAFEIGVDVQKLMDYISGGHFNNTSIERPDDGLEWNDLT